MNVSLGNNIANLPAPAPKATDRGDSASAKAKASSASPVSAKSSDDFQSKLDKELPKNNRPAENEAPAPQSVARTSEQEPIGLEKVGPQKGQPASSEAQTYMDARNADSKLTKQAAMEAFLERMEKEVGVEPSDVLQAFAKLDQSQLLAPPEISAGQFIENLQLPADKKDKAVEIYSQFLAWAATASLSQNLANNGQNAKMQVLTPEQAALKQRLAGLDKLNDKFFMNGEFAAKKMPAAGLQTYGQGQANAGDATVAAAATADAAKAASSQAPGAIDISSMGLQDASPLDQAPSYSDLAKLAQQQSTGAQTAAAAAATPTNLTTVKDGFSTNLSTATTAQNADTAVASKLSIMGMGTNGDQADVGDDLNQDDQADTLDADLADLGHLKQNHHVGQQKFVMEAPKPTDTQMAENIREIINGAQVMVKDGGGEMKIKLTPEGMGEVNLKVMVKDGDVKVEMIASNTETKKLLEKGLADLKTNLATHKLNLDQIKVESPQNSSSQMQMDHQQMAERNFQQRFLQDFQQQNGQRRFDMMGFGPARMMASQTQEDASNDYYNPENRRKRIDRRLDLVA